MDFISTRTMEINKLAMDGLMQRQKAITANTANVMTPDYQRKEVNFESQLKEIVEKDDLKQYIKGQNSIQYNPTSLDMVMGDGKPKLTSQQAKYLQSDIYDKYDPQIIDDVASGSDTNGNNVDIEKEVMDMASVGMRYNVIATLEQREIKNISGVIKGEMSG